MTMISLIVLSYVVTHVKAANPNCCLDVTEIAQLVSTSSCSVICQSKDKAHFDSCITCLTSMSTSYDNAIENKIYSKPVIACQDLLYKETKVTGRVKLTWTPKKPLSAHSFIPLYLVQVRHSAVGNWHFVGMSNLTVAIVNNLEIDLKYQFRITPLGISNLTLSSIFSDWINITDSMTKLKNSVNLSAVDLKFQDNSVQVTIEWTALKEASCSFILYWMPTNKPFYGQKSIIVPTGSSSVILSGLLFQTNYSVKLVPLEPTAVQKFSEIWFVTPSCLILTSGNFSLCAPGPPLNFSVSWIDSGKALATWLPPNQTSQQNEIIGYHLSVIEPSESYHSTLHYKENLVLDKDTLSAVVSDLSLSVSYIFEIRASSTGGIGFPVSVTLKLKEPRPTSQQYSHIPWHYILPSSVIAVVALTIALCLNFYRIQKRSKKVSFPSGTADIPDHILPNLLPSKKIQLYDVIGEGEFGVVHKGLYSHNKWEEMVAVKTFPAESVSRSKLLHEVEILYIIGRHRNIVRLIGFTLDVDKMSLVLEYCPLGNLHTRIQKLKRELSVIKKQLSDPMQPLLENPKASEHYGAKVSSYIHQVALGMEYISSLKLIHRDLAARNILLYNENHVKIADFGLAKDVSQIDAYYVSKQKKLPIRWMAPESLEMHIFTTQSDVWSFGVLMWEIFKFGKIPYSPLNNSAILIYLKNGYRLPKPNATSQRWYDLMLECWHMEPYRRPTFKELVTKTENILSKLCQYSVVVSDQ